MLFSNLLMRWLGPVCFHACECSCGGGGAVDRVVAPQDGEYIVLSATMAVLKKYGSAQDAISAALADMPKGGTLTLLSGCYAIEKPIELVSHVTLRGMGRGTRLGVKGEFGIYAKNADGGRVENLTLVAKDDNAQCGVHFEGVGDSQVVDVFVKGFAKAGIFFTENCFLCEIRGAKTCGNKQSGIWLNRQTGNGNGRGGKFVPTIVTNCISYADQIGYKTTEAMVVNFVACAAYQPVTRGWHIFGISNSVLLSGCRTFQCGSEAVYVENSHEINISSSIFCWHRGDGIVLDNARWGLVSACNIIDSGVRDKQGKFTTGLVMKNGCMGLQISSNAVFNWGDQCPMLYGITEDESCADNSITQNNINYYTEQGVASKGKDTLVKDNKQVGPAAYLSMGKPPYPDFDMAKIEAFMTNQ